MYLPNNTPTSARGLHERIRTCPKAGSLALQHLQYYFVYLHNIFRLHTKARGSHCYHFPIAEMVIYWKQGCPTPALRYRGFGNLRLPVIDLQNTITGTPICTPNWWPSTAYLLSGPASLQLDSAGRNLV